MGKRKKKNKQKGWKPQKPTTSKFFTTTDATQHLKVGFPAFYSAAIKLQIEPVKEAVSAAGNAYKLWSKSDVEKIKTFLLTGKTSNTKEFKSQALSIIKMAPQFADQNEKLEISKRYTQTIYREED